VQSFFLRLIAKDSFAAIHPDKGKLRSFLMASFKKHLASEWRRAYAQKRGGGEVALSIDAGVAEAHFLEDSGSGLSPEDLFDRRWALTVLDQVMAKLGESFASRGQGERFEVLRTLLEPGAGDEGYEEVGARIGLSQNAVQQAVFRMRGEYRKLLEQEIAETVLDRDEVQAELRHLIAAVGG
jgi:RNA polymerase sigma-70 factor (ECF subfamily)